MSGPAFDRAVQDALTGLGTLAEHAQGPAALAAAKAASASLTLLLCSTRTSPLNGVSEAALKDLLEAVTVLRGDDTGTETMPARYDMDGRETLDRIRDILGDGLYVGGCLFNVLKYLDRRGKKGPADLDDSKALFYLQSVANVLLHHQDPRHRRPGFQPYQKHTPHWPTGLLDLAARLEDGIPFGDRAVSVTVSLLDGVGRLQDRLRGGA